MKSLILADKQLSFATLICSSVTSVGLLLALSASGAVAAPLFTDLSSEGNTKAYTPPADTRPPRGPFIPAARRTGCRGVAYDGLTAIAPQQQVGRTFSTQPTLTWFIASGAPYPLTLQLYEYANEEWIKLSDVELGASQLGYGHYTVPTSEALRVGGLYQWNIVMKCDRARPSRNRVDAAQFEVVSPPAGLMPSASSQLAQAQQYATAGFWYDAIALVTDFQPLSSQTAAPFTPDVLNYRKTLLLTLSESESPELSEQLQFIIEVENKL